MNELQITDDKYINYNRNLSTTDIDGNINIVARLNSTIDKNRSIQFFISVEDRETLQQNTEIFAEEVAKFFKDLNETILQEKALPFKLIDMEKILEE